MSKNFYIYNIEINLGRKQVREMTMQVYLPLLLLLNRILTVQITSIQISRLQQQDLAQWQEQRITSIQ